MDDTPHDIEGLIKPARAAKILDVARPTVYKMIASGLLPSVQWSSNGERATVRIDPSDLREFIESHRRSHDSTSCDSTVKSRLAVVD